MMETAMADEYTTVGRTNLILLNSCAPRVHRPGDDRV